METDLAEKGYVIIPNILTPDQITTATRLFYEWIASIPNIKNDHRRINSHGIFKFYQAGHQEHAWYLRTLPAVQQPFKTFYKTDDLTVSYDGCCWLNDSHHKSRDKCWTHTDQAPIDSEFKCLQGFVSLTSNTNSTLVVYEGSHKLHRSYFENNNSTIAWNLINPSYLHDLNDQKRVLQVDAGSLVLWDSRTFHQNQYGQPNYEDRIVQYVCYLPRNHPKNTPAITRKRQKYFHERRTTSHWPYPVHVNGLQPQTYGDSSRKIDYSTLRNPNLQPYMSEIVKLI